MYNFYFIRPIPPAVGIILLVLEQVPIAEKNTKMLITIIHKLTSGSLGRRCIFISLFVFLQVGTMQY